MGYMTEVSAQQVFANLGDSHAALGVLNSLGTLAGRTLTQLNYAVGGETAAETLARVATVTASGATIVVVQTGTNSIPTAASAAEIEQSLADIISAVRVAKQEVWIFTIPPRGNAQQSPPLTNAMVRKLLAINAWLVSTYATARGVTVIDPWTAVAEPITTPADDAGVWHRAGFSVRSGTVTNGGSGYGPNTRIDLTHNGGEGGGLTPVVVNGVITSVTGALRGFGYDPLNKPTAAVVDPDGGGSGATVTVNLIGGIVDYTIANGGLGVAVDAPISAPQGGALSHQAHCVVDGLGTITDTVTDCIGFGYSTQASATVASGASVDITPIMGSPYMWKTPMATGDTHPIAAGLAAQAAVAFVAAPLPYLL